MDKFSKIYYMAERLSTPISEWCESESFEVDTAITRLKELEYKTSNTDEFRKSSVLYLTCLENVSDIIEMEDDDLLENIESFKAIMEEVPANNVGGGNIDGVGVGEDGEPGFTPEQMRKYKNKKKRLKRWQ